MDFILVVFFFFLRQTTLGLCRIKLYPYSLFPAVALWCNGSASDSRSEGWVFESLWCHIFLVYFAKTNSWKNIMLIILLSMNKSLCIFRSGFSFSHLFIYMFFTTKHSLLVQDQTLSILLVSSRGFDNKMINIIFFALLVFAKSCKTYLSVIE